MDSSAAKISVKGTGYKAMFLAPNERVWGALQGFKDKTVPRFTLQLSCDLTEENQDGDCFPSHLQIQASIPYKGETHHVHIRLGRQSLKAINIRPIYRQHVDAAKDSPDYIPPGLWKSFEKKSGAKEAIDDIKVEGVADVKEAAINVAGGANDDKPEHDPRFNRNFATLTTDKVEQVEGQESYQDQSLLSKVTLTFNRDRVLAEGLHVPLDIESISQHHIKAPFLALRDIFANKDSITLYVRSETSDTFVDSWGVLLTRLKAEKDKGDIFRKFYKKSLHHSNVMPYIQLNDYATVAERPKVYHRPNRPVSRDIIEFTTRKGFALIESHEYASASVSEFNQTEHRIKMFRMENLGDLQYLAYFTPGKKLAFRLKKDDNILLQFNDTDKAINDDRWFAKVLPSMDFTLSGDILLYVYRPRKAAPKEWSEEKKANTIMPFVDVDIPCADLGLLVPGIDSEELLTDIVNSAPVLSVKAFFKYSDSTVRRQVESLQALQRGERRLLDPVKDDKGKEIHWAEDAANKDLAQFLLFHTSMPAAFNDWLGPAKKHLEHLKDVDHRDVIDNGLCKAPTPLLNILGPAGTGKTDLMANAITAHVLENVQSKHIVGGPSNQSADVAAVRIAEKFAEHKELQGKIVLRMHHDSAEKQFVKGTAKQAHLQALVSKFPHMVDFVVKNKILTRDEAEKMSPEDLDKKIDNWKEAQELALAAEQDGVEITSKPVEPSKPEVVEAPFVDIFAGVTVPGEEIVATEKTIEVSGAASEKKIEKSDVASEKKIEESDVATEKKIEKSDVASEKKIEESGVSSDEKSVSTDIPTPQEESASEEKTNPATPEDQVKPSDNEINLDAEDADQDTLFSLLDTSNAVPYSKFGTLDTINIGAYDVNGNVILDAQDDNAYISEVVSCAKILRDVSQYMQPGQAFVRDKRVKQYKLSLGYHALCTAGFDTKSFPPNEFTAANKAKFSSFNTYLKRVLTDGEGSLSADDWARFNEGNKELFAFVIEHASVVIGTLTGLCNPLVVRNYQKLSSIWTDEAGQVEVPAFLNTATRYTLVPGGQIIIVGDDKQLSPIVQGPMPLTGFMEENRESILSLCLKARWPSVSLTLNRRSAQSVIDIPSKLFYQGTVKAHPRSSSKGAHEYTVPVAQFMKKWFPDFPKLSAIIYTETPSPAVKDSVSDSWFNMGNIAFSLNLIERLVVEEKIPVTDIGYSSPYTAQCNCMKYGLLKLQTEYAQKGKTFMFTSIKVGSTDSFQGDSAKIFVGDFCLHDRIGFMTDQGRNCVLSTRAEDACFMIGHTPNDPNGKARNYIREMLDESKLSNYHHSLRPDHAWLYHRYAVARVHMTRANIANISAANADGNDQDNNDQDGGGGSWQNDNAAGSSGNDKSANGETSGGSDWDSNPKSSKNNNDGWGDNQQSSSNAKSATGGSDWDSNANPAIYNNSAWGYNQPLPSHVATNNNGSSFDVSFDPPEDPVKPIPRPKRKFGKGNAEFSGDEDLTEEEQEVDVPSIFYPHPETIGSSNLQTWITDPPELKNSLSNQIKKNVGKRAKKLISRITDNGRLPPPAGSLVYYRDQDDNLHPKLDSNDQPLVVTVVDFEESDDENNQPRLDKGKGEADETQSVDLEEIDSAQQKFIERQIRVAMNQEQFGGAGPSS